MVTLELIRLNRPIHANQFIKNKHGVQNVQNRAPLYPIRTPHPSPMLVSTFAKPRLVTLYLIISKRADVDPPGGIRLSGAGVALDTRGDLQTAAGSSYTWSLCVVLA